MTDDAPRRTETHALAAILLTAGAVLLFVGTLCYVRLTPELGLPATAASRLRAVGDALALGPRAMFLAGGFALAGDVFLTAACLALVARHSHAGSDLEPVGWMLLALGAGVAIVFDSMMAVLLEPLARMPDPGTFLAFKAWFDLLFAAGNVPYGLGTIAVLVADGRSAAPLLPRPLALFGMAVGAVAAASGSAYVGGLAVFPAAIGLSVTFGCVVFAVFGVQLWRRESGRALAAPATARLAPEPSR